MGFYKKIQKRINFKWRRLTSRWRAMPSFLIIGAQKSGTSSLHAYLAQHPQIKPAIKKEIHYFSGGFSRTSDNYTKGLEWYRGHFPLKHRLKRNIITFEATPIYLFNPDAPKRIAEVLPNVKLIILLRNPTERAISHYYFQKKHSTVLPIEEAMKKEEYILQEFIDKENYRDPIYAGNSFKSRGLYYDKIQRYLKFFPKEHLLIINSDSLFFETRQTLEKIFSFLGVKEDFVINDLRARLVNCEKEKPDTSVYQYLNQYFATPNEQLFKLIGQTYSWSEKSKNL